MPLLEENGFLPQLNKVPRSIIKKSKLIYINYPNNPTAATAEKDFYNSVVKFAGKNKIIVISDLAYSEINYDNYKPESFLDTRR